MIALEECIPFTVLDLEGALRAPTGVELRTRVDALLRDGQKWIVLNLARLMEIDAAGIGELIRAYNTTNAAGGTLQIERATGRVRQLLSVVGVSRILTEAPEPAAMR